MTLSNLSKQLLGCSRENLPDTPAGVYECTTTAGGGVKFKRYHPGFLKLIGCWTRDPDRFNYAAAQDLGIKDVPPLSDEYNDLVDRLPSGQLVMREDKYLARMAHDDEFIHELDDGSGSPLGSEPSPRWPLEEAFVEATTIHDNELEGLWPTMRNPFSLLDNLHEMEEFSQYNSEKRLFAQSQAQGESPKATGAAPTPEAGASEQTAASPIVKLAEAVADVPRTMFSEQAPVLDVEIPRTSSTSFLALFAPPRTPTAPSRTASPVSSPTWPKDADGTGHDATDDVKAIESSEPGACSLSARSSVRSTASKHVSLPRWEDLSSQGSTAGSSAESSSTNPSIVTANSERVRHSPPQDLRKVELEISGERSSELSHGLRKAKKLPRAPSKVAAEIATVPVMFLSDMDKGAAAHAAVPYVEIPEDEWDATICSWPARLGDMIIKYWNRGTCVRDIARHIRSKDWYLLDSKTGKQLDVEVTVMRFLMTVGLWGAVEKQEQRKSPARRDSAEQTRVDRMERMVVDRLSRSERFS